MVQCIVSSPKFRWLYLVTTVPCLGGSYSPSLPHHTQKENEEYAGVEQQRLRCLCQDTVSATTTFLKNPQRIRRKPSTASRRMKMEGWLNCGKRLVARSIGPATS
jgi:hypothetical protein